MTTEGLIEGEGYCWMLGEGERGGLRGETGGIISETADVSGRRA